MGERSKTTRDTMNEQGLVGRLVQQAEDLRRSVSLQHFCIDRFGTCEPDNCRCRGTEQKVEEPRFYQNGPDDYDIEL